MIRMVKMEIREYTDYREEEILRLYSAAGWTAYTENSTALRKGFEHSLRVLAAYEDGKLAGIVRAVGDGYTVVLIQDILVDPEYRRKGVGTALIRELLERYPDVRQIELVTDDTPETVAFYGSAGFRSLAELGCCGFMKSP